MTVLVALAFAADPSCTAPRERTAFLLTMAPGDDVSTTFGHTALLIYDPALRQESPVYDHGHFDRRSPTFPIDYLRGTAHFWGEKRPLSRIKSLYGRWQRPIRAQQLALTPPQLDALVAHQEGHIGKDQGFAYVWHRVNCTSRIRDAIDHALEGALAPQLTHPSGQNVRTHLLSHAGDAPIGHALAWGSGKNGQVELSHWEAGYFPVGLQRSLLEAKNGSEPLVAEACLIQDGAIPWAPDQEPDRLPLWAGLGTASGLAVIAGAMVGRRTGRAVIAVFTALVGLLGCLDIVVAFYQVGGPWWTHENQILANPLVFSLTFWALGAVRFRLAARLVVGIATVGSLLQLVLGLPHHNAFAIALVLPGLLASITVLERTDPVPEAP